MLLCSTGQHLAHPAGYSRSSPLVQFLIQESFNFSWLEPQRIPNKVHAALLSIHQGRVTCGGKPEEQNARGGQDMRVRGVGGSTGGSAGVHTPLDTHSPSPGTSQSPHANRAVTSCPLSQNSPQVTLQRVWGGEQPICKQLFTFLSYNVWSWCEFRHH